MTSEESSKWSVVAILKHGDTVQKKSGSVNMTGCKEAHMLGLETDLEEENEDERWTTTQTL